MIDRSYLLDKNEYFHFFFQRLIVQFYFFVRNKNNRVMFAKKLIFSHNILITLKEKKSKKLTKHEFMDLLHCFIFIVTV